MSSGPASIVQQNNVPLSLKDIDRRLGFLEQSDGSADWIPVDTGSGNPYSPGYKNSWADVPGEGPLEFKRFLNWLHFRGGFDGGADGTIVFTLPVLYRPKYDQPMLLPLANGSGIGFVQIVAATGDVYYLGAFTGSPGTGAIVEIINGDGFLNIGNPTGPVTEIDLNVGNLDTILVTSIDGGGGALTGDVTFSAGTDISLNQVGQNIEINSTAAAAITLIDSPGASVDVTNPGGPTVSLEVDVAWLATAAVTSIDGGGGPLVGDVTFSPGAGITLSQIAQNIEIDNEGVISITVGTEVLTGDLILTAGTGITLTVIGGDEVVIDSTATGGGIQFVTEPQVGDWLDIETNNVDGSGFGMTFTNVNGLLLDSTGPGVYGLQIDNAQAGADDAFGLLLAINSEDGEARGINIAAASTGAGAVFALQALATGTDGDTIAALIEAGATGTGNVVALKVQGDAGGSGTIDEILVINSAALEIFRVNDEGTTFISNTQPSVFGLNMESVQTGTDAAFGATILAQAVDGDAFALQAFSNSSVSGVSKAIVVEADSTDGPATGIDAQADAGGVGAATGLLLSASGTDGDATGASIEATSSGLGNVIGLRVQCSMTGSGTVTEVLIINSLGDAIFRIDDDGSVHIKTGTAILADLP